MKHAILPWLDSLNSSKRKYILAILAISALVVRIIIAVTTSGYKNDIALFYYWANNVFNDGITQFYNLDIFVDYPPGYIYVLYGLGLLIDLFHVQSGSIAYLFILKLPIIIVDLLFAYVLYSLAKKHLSFSLLVGVLSLFLFNPWTLVNGAVWGQIDIIFSCILVLSLLSFTKENTVKGSLFYALAALIKPQAFIFMPILLVYLVYRKSIKHWFICVIIGFSSFLLMALPFFGHEGGISKLISLYRGTLSSYPYASLNTYNSYTLFGYNWVKIDERIYTIPIELISLIAIAMTVILIFYYSIKMVKTKSTYFYLSSVTIASVYLFVAKMHERYIFPLLVCLLIAYVFEKNKHYVFVIVGYSITTTINLLAVLNIQSVTYTIPYNALTIICSGLNILLFAYLLFIGYKNFKPTKANVSSHTNSNIDREAITAFNDRKKIEKLKVFAVLLLYAIVAFYHLGNKTAPETVWQPKDQGEYVILDLGEVKAINRLVIFSGADHEGEYTISSFENDLWHEQLKITNQHTYALSNQVWPLSVNTQYIMIQATNPKFSLHEIALFNEEQTDTPLSVTVNLTNSPTDEKSSAQHLIDEQSKLLYHPTYLAGAYFDEIYHARTAYEYSVGETVYETTHPPLGKLIMMLGIQLFGFSPFGWRVAGALVSVIMLYAIYRLAKLLFTKHSYALTAMILFAVDFMHFTQSRLGSIDSYLVLFIILMFYFMAVYFKTSFYENKLWKTFIPLSLSGLFFSFAISTKWNGLYGGAGLAIILGVVLIKRYIEGKKMLYLNHQHLKKQTLIEQLKNKVNPQKVSGAIWTTLASCCIFFIFVPIFIYYFVYQISFYLSKHKTGLESFLQAQRDMFDYHSQLVASHPFSSSWYEWQLMIKPIWYYVNNELENSSLTSTIAAFGNPLIWWFSIFTLLFTVIWSIYKKHTLMCVIYIGFIVQMLPWILVDRITFIYHFFPMVPFVILSIVYFFEQLELKFKWGVIFRWQFVIFACLLFIIFYPVLSGQPIEREFIDSKLRWFSSWIF